MSQTTVEARLAPLPAQPRDVPCPTAQWPMGTPAADPTQLAGLLAEAFEGDPSGPMGETHGVVVIQGGRLVLERYGPGYGPDVTCRSWSMAKNSPRSWSASRSATARSTSTPRGRVRADHPR